MKDEELKTEVVKGSQNEEVEYEVFIDSVYGSDLITACDEKEAIDRASEWARETGKTITIAKVTRQHVFDVKCVK